MTWLWKKDTCQYIAWGYNKQSFSLLIDLPMIMWSNQWIALNIICWIKAKQGWSQFPWGLNPWWWVSESVQHHKLWSLLWQKDKGNIFHFNWKLSQQNNVLSINIDLTVSDQVKCPAMFVIWYNRNPPNNPVIEFDCQSNDIEIQYRRSNTNNVCFCS